MANKRFTGSDGGWPKLAFVAPRAASLFFPEVDYAHGGAEMQIYYLSRELAARGLDVTVIVADRGQEADARREGVRVIAAPHKAGIGAKIALQRAMLRTDADCYVQRGRGSSTKEVALFCLWARRKFIYWAAHDIDCSAELAAQMRDTRRNRWFVWGLRRAERVVVQHKGQRDLLRNNESIASTVIPNGLPDCAWDGDAPRNTNLWVGKLTALKDPMAFLKLAKLHPYESFTMIAPRDSDEPDLARLVESSLASQPNVARVDRVPNEGMRDYYRRARTVLVTSLREGFPNVMLEAFRAGAAVVSLRVDPGGMLAENGGGCAVGDFARFAADFERMTRNDEAWERRRRTAFRHAQEELTTTRVADRFLDLIREMYGMPTQAAQKPELKRGRDSEPPAVQAPDEMEFGD